jgi:hypothetical protein
MALIDHCVLTQLFGDVKMKWSEPGRGLFNLSKKSLLFLRPPSCKLSHLRRSMAWGQLSGDKFNTRGVANALPILRNHVHLNAHWLSCKYSLSLCEKVSCYSNMVAATLALCLLYIRKYMCWPIREFNVSTLVHIGCGYSE